MKLSEALQESERHIGQLIELLDVEGTGQRSDALAAARKFEEQYAKYVRSRRCCMNCAFLKSDDAALHVGRVDDPPVCAESEDGRLIYIPKDVAEFGLACPRFTSRYDIPEGS